MTTYAFTGNITALVSDRPLPQSGFVGATPQPDPVGSGGDYGYSVKVIGGSEEVQWQAFSGTKSFRFLPFHKADFTRRLETRFSVEGGPWFTRPAVEITPGQPSTDPRDVSVTLHANDFPPGPFTLRAVSYSSKGSARVHADLVLIAQPTGGSGRYYPVYAYVSSGGSDGTGQADPDWDTAKGHPFATIGAAAAAIQAYRLANFSLNNADFGVVRLSPETHSWIGGAARIIVTDQTWFRIEAEPGHGPIDTILTSASADGGIYCNRLWIDSIKITVARGEAGFISNSNPDVDPQLHLATVNDCIVIGPGQGYSEDESSPIAANIPGKYNTGNTISDMARPIAGSLMRDLIVNRISNDLLVNCLMAAHIVADDLNPYVPLRSAQSQYEIATPSTTSHAIALGASQSYTIATGLTGLIEFYNFEIKHDDNNIMYAAGQSYNSSTGQLDVIITGAKGSGTYNSWIITQLNSAHSDIDQLFGGTGENFVHHDVTVTNAFYQTFFVTDDASRTPDVSQSRHGMAFVDISIQGANPIDTSRPWGGWSVMVDHLLWWNITHDAKPFGIYHEVAIEPTITNFSARYCKFAWFEDQHVSNVDLSDWDHCQFRYISTDPEATPVTSDFIGTNASRWVA
jgi:hypothetical protein